MYEMVMEVNEMRATMRYNDFAEAVAEFKDCVVEAFSKTDERDDYIMKITKDYALFVVECSKVNFRIELKKEA